MADLDARLRRLLDERAESVGPDGPGVPATVVGRAHRRRMGKQAGVGMVAAVALVAVVVQLRPAERATQVVSVPPPTTLIQVTTTVVESSPATTVAQATVAPATTVAPPTTVALPAGVPRTFAALTADGRLAVVDTATGVPTRWVTELREGYGASDLSLTADRRYAYSTRFSNETCFAELELAQLDDGPVALPALPPASPAGFTQHRPLPRPGTGDLAFARSTCQPIGERTNVIVIGRSSTTAWSEHTYAGYVPLAWSPDGRQLYAENEADWSVVVLDVSPTGEVTGQKTVPLDGTCHRASLVVAPTTGHLVADMACTTGTYRRDLLEIDPATGTALGSVVPVTSRGLWGGVSYDVTGEHLLYTDGGVHRLDDNGPVRLAPADRYTDVAW